MTFTASLAQQGRTATITLEGALDDTAAAAFRDKIATASQSELDRLVLEMSRLESISSAGLRGLTFCRQKMGDDVRIVLVAANPDVRRRIEQVDLDRSVSFADRLPD